MRHNSWGGSFELNGDNTTEEKSPNTASWDGESISQTTEYRRILDETQQSWILDPSAESDKKKKYIDLGCIVCSKRALKWAIWSFALILLVIALPIIIVASLPEHKDGPRRDSNCTYALRLALQFFDAQKSGKLPKNHTFAWRGDSGLQDGAKLTDLPWGLVGGYYDGGDNTKSHFPMSFAMTMLSWSVVEYESKYRAINEYRNVRERIRWGMDYLLLTFNSTATTIDRIYSRVGGPSNGPNNRPDDRYCWQRPEDMDYPRRARIAFHGPELAGEMAAAFAAASIVFRDDSAYSKRLVDGAKAVFSFAQSYPRENPYVEPYYKSTGYYDEYMWGAAWLYYATGDASYFSLATNPDIPRKAKAFEMKLDLRVLSWDNKLPASMLVLTRARLFLSPGYPYEEMLRNYQHVTLLTMCSYLKRFKVFNFTRGGLIELSHGRAQELQYVANAAFLASLFADYLTASGAPGWNCGPYFLPTTDLKDFASSQINYILGKNSKRMSYVVGYGAKYPNRVHHRGASIPHSSRVKYSCTGGWKWRDSPAKNPNTIYGAMVRGPDRFDGFKDVRTNYNYTEPTLTGNAGLVAALVSLTTDGDVGVNKNSIFSALQPVIIPSPPPPPAPWKP